MTHPRLHALADPARPAVLMSDGSGHLTYGELEDRANRGAQLLRSLGIRQGETIAYWLPNCPEVFEVYWAGQRAGLYITPIATGLTASEADYIIENSGSRLLVVSPEIGGLAELPARADVTVLTLSQWREALAAQPARPIADEAPGFHMVYSSGTTGRPKGIRLPLPQGEVTASHMLAELSASAYGTGPQTIYLSPAPLYHTAPLAYTTSCHRLGGTVVVMPKFDPEAALAAIERFKVTPRRWCRRCSCACSSYRPKSARAMIFPRSRW